LQKSRERNAPSDSGFLRRRKNRKNTREGGGRRKEWPMPKGVQNQRATGWTSFQDGSAASRIIQRWAVRWAYPCTPPIALQNRQRRVHIHARNWAGAQTADACLDGPTERATKAEPPEYVLVSTGIGREKRFSSNHFAAAHRGGLARDQGARRGCRRQTPIGPIPNFGGLPKGRSGAKLEYRRIRQKTRRFAGLVEDPKDKNLAGHRD